MVMMAMVTVMTIQNEYDGDEDATYGMGISHDVGYHAVAFAHGALG